MADAITGKSAKKQLAMSRAAQAEQAARIAEGERKVKAVEDAQGKIREGQGRGMLAFVDEALKKTFGG